METEDHYKKKATSYRTSPEYGKMISLYPILKTSIKDCKGEKLVAQRIDSEILNYLKSFNFSFFDGFFQKKHHCPFNIQKTL